MKNFFQDFSADKLDGTFPLHSQKKSTCQQFAVCEWGSVLDRLLFPRHIAHQSFIEPDGLVAVGGGKFAGFFNAVKMVGNVVEIVAVRVLFVCHQIDGVAGIFSEFGIFFFNFFQSGVVAAKKIAHKNNIVKTVIKAVVGNYVMRHIFFVMKSDICNLRGMFFADVGFGTEEATRKAAGTALFKNRKVVGIGHCPMDDHWGDKALSAGKTANFPVNKIVIFGNFHLVGVLIRPVRKFAVCVK